MNATALILVVGSAALLLCGLVPMTLLALQARLHPLGWCVLLAKFPFAAIGQAMKAALIAPFTYPACAIFAVVPAGLIGGGDETYINFSVGLIPVVAIGLYLKFVLDWAHESVDAERSASGVPLKSRLRLLKCRLGRHTLDNECRCSGCGGLFHSFAREQCTVCGYQLPATATDSDSGGCQWCGCRGACNCMSAYVH